MKSDKSVLVVDTPQCCFECHYCHFYGKYGYRKCLLSKEFVDVQDDTIDILKERHKCCPLRPLPDSKKVIASGKVKVVNYLYANGFADGYNACLKEITGETE